MDEGLDRHRRAEARGADGGRHRAGVPAPAVAEGPALSALGVYYATLAWPLRRGQSMRPASGGATEADRLVFGLFPGESGNNPSDDDRECDEERVDEQRSDDDRRHHNVSGRVQSANSDGPKARLRSEFRLLK